MNRRIFLTSLGAASAALALPGCANRANQAGPDQAPGAGAPSGSADPGFPTTVEHRYGSTTVPSAPQRVLTLGQTDHDPVIALGVTPIAVAGFLGSSYSPFRPWNSEQLATKPPVLDMLEVEYEKVAALAPDLILSVMSGLTKEGYAKLSAIAPTVAQPVGYADWAVPYQPHTELIGAALGRAGEAKDLVTQLDAAFATVRRDNPMLAGKRTVCAELNAGEFTVLGTAAPRTHFLSDVGMTVSKPLTDLAGKAYNASISMEKLDLLDNLDVIVWTTDEKDVPTLLNQRIVRTLNTTKEHRYVLASNGGDDNLLYSLDWGTILSNRWAIDNAVPRIVRAADGDTTTDPNQA